MTADCWTRLRAARRRGLLHLAAVMLLVVVPELLSMRFGIGHLRRRVGLGPGQPPAAPQVQLPPAPASFHRDVALGEIDFPDPAAQERVLEQLMSTAVGFIGHREPPFKPPMR